jgi:protein-disulfide isomerase
MIRRIMLSALAVVALLGAAPAARDWTKTVTQTPTGAYVLGNPAAKVRFVEYLSYTCPHCARFTNEAAVPIKRDFVAKGLIAVEVRHAVRDQFDMAATLMARCGGATKFFGNSEAIMARQDIWLADAQLYAVRDAPKYKTLPIAAQLRIVARATGLDQIVMARGVTAVQVNACLASKPMQDVALAMTKEAFSVRKISGTPHFLINGKTAPYSDNWAGMEPTLSAAIAAK